MDDYLYRNEIPGKPELNGMNTALSMGGNNVNDGTALTAPGTITVGGNVETSGTVTAGSNVNSFGTVLPEAT